MSDTRKLFFDTLIEHAKVDKSTMFLTGDLGYNFQERYQVLFPKQYMNCGINEQAMVGLAAGMALGGKRPIVYSGAIFLLYRALEQIRDDIAIPNLNVKLVGTGAADFLGFTHVFQPGESAKRLVELIPNLTYAEPRSEAEMRNALAHEGPLFIRL